MRSRPSSASVIVSDPSIGYATLAVVVGIAFIFNGLLISGSDSQIEGHLFTYVY